MPHPFPHLLHRSRLATGTNLLRTALSLRHSSAALVELVSDPDEQLSQAAAEAAASVRDARNRLTVLIGLLGAKADAEIDEHFLRSAGGGL